MKKLLHHSKASWPTVKSATAYEVDLSKDQNFSTFVEPYEDYQIFTNEIVFLNLEKEVQYYVGLGQKMKDAEQAIILLQKVGQRKEYLNPHQD